jgi:hypothetical protein
MMQSKVLIKTKKKCNGDGNSGRRHGMCRLIISAFAFLLFIAQGLMCTAQNDASDGTVNLDGGINAVVTNVRTWKEFDAVFPNDQSARNWVSGDVIIYDATPPGINLSGTSPPLGNRLPRKRKAGFGKYSFGSPTPVKIRLNSILWEKGKA